MGQDLAARARHNVERRGTAQPQQVQETTTVYQVIQKMQGEIARALPKHLDADRMARLALTAVRKNPKLAECTPTSFAGALLTAAALGLEVDVNGEAYLVPYRDTKKRITECQLIVGYQGIAKQYFQSPLASYIDAQAVYENDLFDWQYGTDPYLRHKPARGDRGKVTDYYAVAKLSTGATRFVVLSPEEVKELRRGKVGPSGDIADPQRWMERKTALKQLVKLLPKSTSLVAVATADEQLGSDLYRERMRERESVIDVDPTPPAIAPAAPQDDGVADDGGGWPDEPAAEPARESEPEPQDIALITEPQNKLLHQLMRKDALTTRDAQLEWLTAQMRRPVASSKDLSKAEASELIDFLQHEQAKDQAKAAATSETTE